MYCFPEVKGDIQTRIFQDYIQILCILHIILTYFIIKMGESIRKPVNSTTCGLPEARIIFDELPMDLQTQIVEDYIKPELDAHCLCEEFKTMIHIKPGSRNNIWFNKYIDKLRMILENECALKIMRSTDANFEDSYFLHIIRKKKVFPKIDCIIESMAVHIVSMNN